MFERWRKNQRIPINIRMSGPWIMWSIWKNRKSFFFEGFSLSPTFTRSIYEEVDHWFLIKDVENRNLIWKEKRGSSLAGNLLLLLGFSVTILALPWTNSVMNVEFLGFSVTMKAKCYYMDEVFYQHPYQVGRFL